MKNLITLFLIGFFLGGVNSQTVNDIEFKEIQQGFWQVVSYGDYKGTPFPSNSMIVENGDSLIMIDTPWGVNPTKILLKKLKEKFNNKPIAKAILTHWHGDSSGGVSVLKEHNIPTYSYYKTWNRLLQTPNRVSTDSVLYKTVTKFDLGNDRTMKVFYPGEGHSLDNTVVYFPEDKVLFGGCFLKSDNAKNLGYYADGNVDRWYYSIRKLQGRFAIPVKKVIQVPGHGEASYNAIKHTLELLKEYRNKQKQEKKNQKAKSA